MSLDIVQGEIRNCLYVRDIMTDDLFTVYEDDNLNTLNDLMEWRAIRHVPVIDDEYRLIGLITHRDVLKLAISKLADISEMEERQIYEKIPVREIMGKKMFVVGPKTSITEVADIMSKHKVGCVPVVDEKNKLLGIVTEADFVQLFAKGADFIKLYC